MSRLTPETDAEVILCHGIPHGFNPPERSYTSSKFARKLERERDEARAQVKELIYIAARAIDLAEIDFENDKFGVVSELRDGLETIKEGTK